MADRVGRRFARDEAGVSEVVGFLITFGISTVLLITSLLAMGVIRDFADDAAAERQVQEIAARVQERVLKAANAATDANLRYADYESVVPLPPAIGGRAYVVELDSETVRVIASGGAAAVLPLLNVASDLLFCTTPDDANEVAKCRVSSGEGSVTVVYRELNPGTPEAERLIFFSKA